MTVIEKNGKNGEPMEVLNEKPRHVSGESDSEEEYHGRQFSFKLLFDKLVLRISKRHKSTD